MKRPKNSAAHPSQPIRAATTRRPVRAVRADKLGLAERAARVASGGVKTTTAKVYNETRKQARGAATALDNTVEQRPRLAMLVTGALGLMLGFLLPRR